MDFIYKKKKNSFYSLLENKGLGFYRAKFIQKRMGLNLRKTPLYLFKNTIDIIKERTSGLFLNKSYTRMWYDFRNFNNSLKTCRSVRNRTGLPVRGQRTRTNAKTKKKFKF